MAGEDIAHELGRLGAHIEALKERVDRHITAEEARAKETTATLGEILAQTTATNGRVDRLEKWRTSAAEQLAGVRKVELDGEAVQRWWQQKRGQAAIVAGAVTFVLGGAVQLAAAVKALGG